MAKKGPSFYNVALTAIRNYEPGKGPPRKSQFWTFSQVVDSVDGYPGALSAMVDKFFDLYPNHAIVLPMGEHGQKIITRSSRSGLDGYLTGKRSSSGGDFDIESSDASLRIHKMRALSGETPISLTPKSEKEYDDKLHQNVESYKWWQDPIVQMPSPIYVLENASASVDGVPGVITYRGRVYHRADAVPIENIPSERTKGIFFAMMEEVAEKMTDVHQLLVDAGELLHADEGGAGELLSEAARTTYKEVLPAILNARDLAYHLKG